MTSWCYSFGSLVTDMLFRFLKSENLLKSTNWSNWSSGVLRFSEKFKLTSTRSAVVVSCFRVHPKNPDSVTHDIHIRKIKLNGVQEGHTLEMNETPLKVKNDFRIKLLLKMQMAICVSIRFYYIPTLSLLKCIAFTIQNHEKDIFCSSSKTDFVTSLWHDPTDKMREITVVITLWILIYM